jgi:hypothetical protein
MKDTINKLLFFSLLGSIGLLVISGTGILNAHTAQAKIGTASAPPPAPQANPSNKNVYPSALAAAKEFHATVKAAIKKDLTDNRGDLVAATNATATQLVDQSVITPEDAPVMVNITKTLISGPYDNASMIKKARAICDDVGNLASDFSVNWGYDACQVATDIFSGASDFGGIIRDVFAFNNAQPHSAPRTDIGNVTNTLAGIQLYTELKSAQQAGANGAVNGPDGVSVAAHVKAHDFWDFAGAALPIVLSFF